MPEQPAPRLDDPEMWWPKRVPGVLVWVVKEEELPEGEADEPHIVDGEPEEPQP
ncbi:MAG TPA: hypothetical protein VH643_03245 [Gemmataceae bacterium]|jgi:hypothetical protein